jgi:hypothetical protein
VEDSIADDHTTSIKRWSTISRTVVTMDTVIIACSAPHSDLFLLPRRPGRRPLAYEVNALTELRCSDSAMQGPLRQLRRRGTGRDQQRRAAPPPAVQAGNRQLNCALHLITLQQVCHNREGGGDYYRRKLAAGISPKGAMRRLQRRIAGKLYRRLQADRSRRPVATTRPVPRPVLLHMPTPGDAW